MSATERGLAELAPADMERRLANSIRYGKVLEINHADKLVRIKSGNIETDWIKWPAGRSGAGKRRWDPPEVGEQVVMLSPGGDMKQASILPGMYQDSHDAPSADPNEDLAEYSDGTIIGYNRSTHKLTANLQSDTSIIADRTSIKATRGEGSVEITDTFIKGIVGAGSVEITDTNVKAALGSASVEVTATSITLTVAGSTITLNAAGITQTGAAINLN